MALARLNASSAQTAVVVEAFTSVDHSISVGGGNKKSVVL